MKAKGKPKEVAVSSMVPLLGIRVVRHDTTERTWVEMLCPLCHLVVELYDVRVFPKFVPPELIAKFMLHLGMCSGLWGKRKETK